ncbi:MAG: tetratricopeptide repeat protein [Bacteroidota bacterium]
MRQVLICCLMFLFLVDGMAQTRRMANPLRGKEFSAENFGRTELPLLLKADQELSMLNLDETLFTLDNAVAQNPNSPEALLLRARFKYIIGMPTQANEDYEQARRLNPYVADLYGYHGNAGLLRVMSIQPQQAVQSISTFQKLGYYYEEIDRQMAQGKLLGGEMEWIEQIILVIEGNLLEEALEKVDSLLQQYPQSALAYDLKGVIFLDQNKLEDAEGAFFKAVELQKDFALAWYNLGQLEYLRNNLSDAKTYLDKAISLQENLTKAYFERAMVLKAMGDTEGALRDYDYVINLRGETYFEAFLNRGLTKKMLGDFDEAFMDLNLVLEHYPNNAELYKNRANLYLLSGNYWQAIGDYSDAIQLNRDFAEAYFNRGLAHFLVYDKVSGCTDLGRSSDLGYEPAKEQLRYFCAR